MNDIKNFWGDKLADPSSAMPDVVIEALLPEFAEDKDGNLWVLEMSYFQANPDDNATRMLCARYSRFNKRTGALEGVVDSFIPNADLDKLKEHRYCSFVLENIRARIEDKNREIKQQEKVMVNRYKSVPKGGH